MLRKFLLAVIPTLQTGLPQVVAAVLLLIASALLGAWKQPYKAQLCGFLVDPLYKIRHFLYESIGPSYLAGLVIESAKIPRAFGLRQPGIAFDLYAVRRNAVAG